MERSSSARVEQPSRLPCPHSWGYAFRAVPGDVSLSGRTLTYTALYDGYGIAVRLTVRIMVAGLGLARAARCGRSTRFASKCCTARATSSTRRPATGVLATTIRLTSPGDA